MVSESTAWLMGSDRFELNAWTPLLYKNVMATRTKPGIDWMAPTWMGEHRQRIQAYTAFGAYRENAARLLERAITQEEREARDDRREYGDAGLLLEQIRSAVLGDRQSIVVEGADEFDPDNPTPEAQVASERQDFLRKWADDEQLTTKMIETERNAVSMGDGVYSLGWDARTRRVALRTWDPGAYFPVLDDNAGHDYPDRVHLAWQIEDPDVVGGEIRIRRITFDLREVEPYTVPWEDKPVTKACFLTDMTFVLDENVRTVDDLTYKTAVAAVDELGEIVERNLGIDFLPVIHIPNTVAIDNHFGQSSLAKVLQILDDIQATDSDLSASAALTGNPTLVVSGTARDGSLRMGPGVALEVGKDGSADIISGAEHLDPLAQYRDGLLKRLSVNARVPEAVLGRVDPSKVAAGIVLSLSFGPLGSLIDGEMRPARKDPYKLIPKFVQRFYMKEAQSPDADAEIKAMFSGAEVLPAEIVFGSFLPSDQQGTVKMVTELYAAKLISRETAHKMLQEVGIPVDDFATETAKIDQRDFEGASQLLDATGNEQAVGNFLGVEVDRPAPEDIVEQITPAVPPTEPTEPNTPEDQ